MDLQRRRVAQSLIVSSDPRRCLKDDFPRKHRAVNMYYLFAFRKVERHRKGSRVAATSARPPAGDTCTSARRRGRIEEFRLRVATAFIRAARLHSPFYRSMDVMYGSNGYWRPLPAGMWGVETVQH
ncbi:hypothetical protein EVAR_37748_1 [Eumeta japonica]|uniref:Uncharacterized protein n=1 Tax=Eumeta variegata TaxID=151549 RepID=A0A4C1WM48_EUMVA|nr:hypothetical protein EVAR_37748_1 [Eumeta japonica]